MSSLFSFIAFTSAGLKSLEFAMFPLLPVHPFLLQAPLIPSPRPMETPLPAGGPSDAHDVLSDTLTHNTTVVAHSVVGACPHVCPPPLIGNSTRTITSSLSLLCPQHNAGYILVEEMYLECKNLFFLTRSEQAHPRHFLSPSYVHCWEHPSTSGTGKSDECCQQGGSQKDSFPPGRLPGGSAIGAGSWRTDRIPPTYGHGRR